MKRKLRRGIVDGDNHAKDFAAVERIVREHKEMANMAHNTVKGYGRVFSALTEYFGKDMDAFNITHGQAKDFVKWLQTDKVHYRDKLNSTGIQRGLRPSTINTYIKLCKSVYAVLECEGHIAANPFENIPTMRRDKERIKTIPPEDIRLLLESLDKHYYTEFRMYVVIHVLLDTFGRIDEVLSIKKSDVDFEKRTIYFSKTKTNDPRFVSFSAKTKQLLIELIDECREFNSDYVFLGINGERFMPEAFRANLKRYCSIYGVKTHITPHMFRHTAAMLFLENGGNMRVLQKILGHKRIATTEIYAHVSDNLIMAQQNDYSPMGQIMKSDKKISMRRSKRIR